MIICYKNNRAHYSVIDQMLSIFFVCINILIVMVNLNFHIVNIINMHSAFYKFKSPLDYSVQTKKIEYFTYDIDKRFRARRMRAAMWALLQSQAESYLPSSSDRQDPGGLHNTYP